MKPIIFSIILSVSIALSGCHSPHNNESDVHDHHSHDLQEEEQDHMNEKGHDHMNESEEESDHMDENHMHDEDHHSGHEEEVHLSDKDFAVVKMKKQSFYTVIKTSGELLPAQIDEKIIPAKHEGIIRFVGKNLFKGEVVKKDEHLITISGEEMTDNNLKLDLVNAQSEFSKAETNYKRAIELKKDTLISDKEFREIEAKFKTTKSVFESTSKNYENGGQIVKSPFSGYISKIHVSNGQYIEAGNPIISIAKNNRLILKADVNQEYTKLIPQIHCANFRTSYSKEFMDTEKMDGKVVSYGKSAEHGAFYTPIYFELNNTKELIPGSFVEVNLKVHSQNEILAVPKSAIMEEQGYYFVFVKEHEDFEKVKVSLGGSDGQLVEITDGIHEGDLVATQNVYRIKLSKLKDAMPAHNHNH